MLQCSKEKNNDTNEALLMTALALNPSSSETKTDSSTDTEPTTEDGTTTEDSQEQTVELAEQFNYSGQSTTLALKQGDSVHITTQASFTNYGVLYAVRDGNVSAAYCTGENSNAISCDTAYTDLTLDTSKTATLSDFTLTVATTGNYFFQFGGSSDVQNNTPSYSINGTKVNFSEIFSYEGFMSFSVKANQKVQFLTDSQLTAIVAYIFKDGYQSGITTSYPGLSMSNLFGACSGTSPNAVTCSGNAYFGGTNSSIIFGVDSSITTPNFTLTAPESGTYNFYLYTYSTTRISSTITYTGKKIIE